jgi:hypothetical protein
MLPPNDVASLSHHVHNERPKRSNGSEQWVVHPRGYLVDHHEERVGLIEE